MMLFMLKVMSKYKRKFSVLLQAKKNNASNHIDLLDIFKNKPEILTWIFDIIYTYK